MTTLQNTPTVAEYLAGQIEASGVNIEDVAEAIGYDNADMVLAMMRGTVKIPFNKVGPLARALDISSPYFMRLVVAEYAPDILAMVDDIIRTPPLTQNERELVDAYRRVTKGTDARAVICDAKDVVAMIMV